MMFRSLPLWLLVGLGGFVGSVARYLASGTVQRLFPLLRLPGGTLLVNMTGCAVIGALGALVEYRGLFSPQARVLLMIGVLGGFTTFSSFGFETLELAREGHLGLGLVNVALQVGGGLVAVWLGHSIIRLL
ncbi:MAG TPA: fluoride efflux transporter CrcB [Acidobacteria bacterium]|nr:fluoride efflux transporter CrcB [Acidobacteriota bacterium]